MSKRGWTRKRPKAKKVADYNEELCRFVQRPDGFVSADADYTGAYVVYELTK
jgi:hypothetical protein